MRLFVAIPLADRVSRELAAFVARLRAGESSESGLRWSAPESWHITLQFLGNTTAEQLECLKAHLNEVRAARVHVELGELGCFDRAGIVFLDVVVTPQLAALEKSVVAATSRCGFAAEARPFHPHITLARKLGNKGLRDRGNKKTGPQSPVDRGGRDAPLRNNVGPGGESGITPFTAGEFVLYESHLGPGGARYEALLRVALGDKPAPMPSGNG